MGQSGRHPRQYAPEEAGVGGQGPAEGLEIGRARQCRVDGRPQVDRNRLAGRRRVSERLCSHVEEGLRDLADRIRGHLDDRDDIVLAAEEAIADAVLLQVGDHAGSEERRLAQPALAVEDEDPRVGTVEPGGEPDDIGVAAGEQGAVGAIVEAQ